LATEKSGEKIKKTVRRRLPLPAAVSPHLD
jgi:hypothetical protein